MTIIVARERLVRVVLLTIAMLCHVMTALVCVRRVLPFSFITHFPPALVLFTDFSLVNLHVLEPFFGSLLIA